jgi:taurine dioxygenase
MAESVLDVRPMPIGAEIPALPAGGERDPAIKAALYDAWLEHGILLFRNIETVEQHLSLSEAFGELEPHPFIPVRSAVHPMLMDVGGDRRGPAQVYDETDMRINRISWHRDTADTVDICKGSMLRMLEVPSEEGETMLADTAKAYDDLPPDIKAQLDGLEYKATHKIGSRGPAGPPGAFWKTMRRATADEDPEGGRTYEDDPKAVAEMQALRPSVVHPAMLTHPESGRKCIFLSPMYFDFFIGMPQSESDQLLRFLLDHMLQEKYVYKHRWSVNDAILWDNRRFLHAGAGNKVSDRRRGLRTTLAAPARIGRFFDEDAQTHASNLAG